MCSPLALLLIFAVPSMGAFAPTPIPHPVPPHSDSTIHNETFCQYISHEDHSLGEFSQRYWYSTEFWKGPGSPVVFFNPGEVAADNYTGYLTNKTLTGLLAEAIGAAVVMLEHRYWGGSSPYHSLTTKNLQHLTVHEAILDFTRFARTVELPFDPSGQSNPDKAPWIIFGGSYSGALSAWTQATEPGTFWAYHASSAPVEAIYDYWQYFVPIQGGMPKNCSKDVSLVVDYIDGVLTTGSGANKTALKTMFGLAELEHDVDFAAVLANGPWLWQTSSFTTGYSHFFRFCDHVEGVTPGQAEGVPGESGVGLQAALKGYASWVNESFIPGYCTRYGYEGDRNVQCFDTHNASKPQYTDLSVDSHYDRQWQWLLCNEPLNYWQTGAPHGRPSLVSRLVTAEYWQRQCDLFFPPDEEGYTYGVSKTHHSRRTVDTVNDRTSGWFLPDKQNSTTRLLWGNGEFDPWRTATVASEFRPGGPYMGTMEQPSLIIPGGFHCSELRAANGLANEGVQQVMDDAIAIHKGWVEEFYQERGIVRP